MRTVVQVSDLHFGTILEPTLEPLLESLHGINPDLVIVSGDITQRAREEQFQQARAYVNRMPGHKLVIPGNHDIPLYDVFRRFLKPLVHYERYITDNLAPFFIDDEIAVVSINSSRSLTFKGGRISADQVAAARARFANLGGDPVRIVVTHHPFDVPVALSGVDVVGGARHAIEELSQCNVSLYLTGHLHLFIVPQRQFMCRVIMPCYLVPVQRPQPAREESRTPFLYSALITLARKASASPSKHTAGMRLSTSSKLQTLAVLHAFQLRQVMAMAAESLRSVSVVWDRPCP